MPAKEGSGGLSTVNSRSKQERIFRRGETKLADRKRDRHHRQRDHQQLQHEDANAGHLIRDHPLRMLY